MSTTPFIRPAHADDIGALAALDTVASRDPDRAKQITLWVQAGQTRMAERDGWSEPLGLDQRGRKN